MASTLEKIMKALPAELNHSSGKLMIVKKNNEKYFCCYPVNQQKVKTTKGESIHEVAFKMYVQLINKGIISKEKPKKKWEKKEVLNPLPKKEKLRRKLNIQNKQLKNK